MMEFEREGDQIVITRLDRLSCSSMELQDTAKTLENKKVDLMGAKRFGASRSTVCRILES